MATVASLDVQLRAFTSEFTDKLNKALKPVQTLGDRIGSLSRRVIGLGAAFVGFKIGSGIINGLRSTADHLDRIGKTSAKLGITAEALQELRFGASQSGIEINTLDMALQRMTRRLAEASIGKGEALPALQELGLSPQSLAGLSPDQQLARIADALQRVEGQANKVRIAFKLFDSEGVGMVNLLQDGSRGLNAFAAEARQAGLVLDSAGIKKVEATNDALDKAKKSIESMGAAILIGLAPSLEKLAKEFEKLNPLFEKFNNMVLAAFGDSVGSNAAYMDKLKEHGERFKNALPENLRRPDLAFNPYAAAFEMHVPTAPQVRVRSPEEQQRALLEQRRDMLRGMLPGLGGFSGSLDTPQLLQQGSVAAANFLNQFRSGGSRTQGVMDLIKKAAESNKLLEDIRRELERIERKLDEDGDQLFGFVGG